MNKAIMTHVVAGYPSMEKCEELVMLMADSGVKFIEIQIPFSDPVADGPTILQANQKALASGVRVNDCFELMASLKKKTDTPLLFMTYFNILHAFGVEKFIKKTASLGCYGLIVPDIPMDEEKHEHFLEFCKKYGLKAIQVISPLTPEDRLKAISRVADGFVYCVSHYGTTGSKNNLNPDLKKYLEKVRKFINLPLAVGFGISSKEQIKSVHKYAEIAVIGSKILKLAESDDLNSIRDLLN